MPTITHDGENQAVTIYVVVSLNPDGEDITIGAAPIALPQGTWTLRWNLVVTSPGLQAAFTPPGILVVKAPPMVDFGPIARETDHCTATVTNTVTGTDQFNYWISVSWPKGSAQTPIVKTVHDPTIAVTQDPVGSQWTGSAGGAGER
jgi:hypothetical protein